MNRTPDYKIDQIRMFYKSQLSSGATKLEALSSTSAEFKRSTRQVRRILGDDIPKRITFRNVGTYGDAQQTANDLKAILSSFGNNEWGPHADALLSGLTEHQLERIGWWIEHSPYYRKALREASIIKSMRKIILARLRDAVVQESAEAKPVGEENHPKNGVTNAAVGASTPQQNADASQSVEPLLL